MHDGVRECDMGHTMETHAAAYRAVRDAVAEAIRQNGMLTVSHKHPEVLIGSITWQLLDRGAIKVLAAAGWASAVVTPQQCPQI
jgi:hypothetical protein